MKLDLQRLAHLPVSLFSMILGLAGWSIALQKAEHTFGWKFYASPVALAFTLALFIFLLGLYAYKALAHRNEVLKEFSHPIKMAFFPAMSIGLVLVSTALVEEHADWSRNLWIVGSSLHLLFTLRIVSIWIHHEKFEINHMNPSWFIPAVGNILVPVAGMQHASAEINWFFFSIGFFFWAVLLVLFFNRIIFHQPLPQKLLPTLFILIAPPAVGFVSSVKLLGSVTPFGTVLYFIALFFALLLTLQFNLFRKIQFALSWWAYSFPMAAMFLASNLMYKSTGNPLFSGLSMYFMGVLTLVILLLLYRTIVAALRREICVPE